MKRSLGGIVLTLFLALRAFGQEGRGADAAVYDPDPNHLWNRLNETLFVRTAPDGKRFGRDELDILYWHTTRNLLIEPSRQQALAVLEEFVDTQGERLIRDPLKRALLQRDLWELFDWSVTSVGNSDTAWKAWDGPADDFQKSNPPRTIRELQARLVQLIRRLALTTNEIASLPDNYAQAEKNQLAGLPRGLFETNGSWVNVGLSHSFEPVAPTHVASFGGHSAFYVMLHLPEGRSATLAYLDRLQLFAQVDRVWNYRTNNQPWLSTNTTSVPATPQVPGSTNPVTWKEVTFVTTNFPRHILELSPDLPQFPEKTEWALVRRVCVIDTDGRIQPTSVTESVQLRRYDQLRAIYDVRQVAQQFSEFQLDRRRNGALRAIGQDEKGFPFVHFMGHGIDVFETAYATRKPPPDSTKLQEVPLRTCFTCHNDRGLYSVLSYTGFASPHSSQRPADLRMADLAQEASAAVDWKRRQFDWGLLQGLWRQAN